MQTPSSANGLEAKDGSAAAVSCCRGTTAGEFLKHPLDDGTNQQLPALQSGRGPAETLKGTGHTQNKMQPPRSKIWPGP